MLNLRNRLSNVVRVAIVSIECKKGRNTFSSVRHLLGKRALTMWNILVNFARSRFPVIVLPVAIAIGAVGYGLESKYRRQKVVTHPKSVQEERDERLLRELSEGKTLDQGPSILEWQPGRGITEKERMRGKKTVD